MIPVMIVPVINRFDLLEKMLRTLEGKVERFVIVENSCTGYQLPSSFDTYPIFWIRPPFVSMGYGGSINAGIIQTPESPWWAFTNADLTFGPDDPDEIVRLMEIPEGPKIVTHGYCWGAVNRELVDLIGFFDDWTLFPIYFDDNDYQRRVELAGAKFIPYQGGIVHGDNGKGSLTIRSDERMLLGNYRTFPMNRQRYIEKWGGLPAQETFTTPWNSGYPLWYTKPDIDGRRDRRW